jgi:hypothetical protein
MIQPQVAAWVPVMFRNFYIGKNHKIAKNSTATKSREKITTDFVTFRILFLKIMYVWINLKTIKFYLIKLATDLYWQPIYLLSERSSFDGCMSKTCFELNVVFELYISLKKVVN